MKKYAIAFDIGTTTVVGALVDLNNGKRLSLASRMNEQAAYGDDAISRISFAQLKENGLKLLNEKIIDVLNQIIDETTSSAGVKREGISQIVAVGNTVMHHLVLSIPLEDLVRPPYGPRVTEPFSIDAKDLGVEVASGAYFKFLPLIGGFVGADAVGLILSTQIDRSEQVKLAVDIGTNGEVIIGSCKRLLVTSCAAGPAFEGWHISCGMRASRGAIDRVRIEDGQVKLGTIGGGAPRGICGSGLIDAASELLKAGIIDQSGKMGPERFNLYKDKSTSIDITKADVRELQLAKAAIRAGIEILKKNLGTKDSDISAFLLAGAFGNYIRPESAIRIGLIPEVGLDKVRFIEDAPLRGAEIAVCSSQAMRRALEISKRTEHIDLSSQKDFQEEFARQMGFL